VKSKRLQFSVEMFCGLLLLLAMPVQPVASAPSAETYKQNAQGLEKQFEAFLKAFHRNDDKGMDEGFAIFRLPHAKEWFGNYFSPEDAERLSSAYNAEVNDGENSLIGLMNGADPGSKYRVRCEPRGDAEAGQAKGGESGIQPLKSMSVEQFRLEFRSWDHNQKFSFIANFVYVDGAYRYVGGGGVAFWAKPGGVR